MPFKAVVFDLDGTLIDTLEDLGNAMNRILMERGLPTHNMDAYRHFIGDGVAMLVTRALPEEKRNDDSISVYSEAFREEYSKNWNVMTKPYDSVPEMQEYSKNWNVMTKPYDSVPEMLDALKLGGLKMSILSNKPHDFTELCVSELLPNWNFDVVIGQRDSVPLKPDPTSALEIAEFLNIPPVDFLYLGDTDIDMKTAIAAGMFPAGVLWGFRSAEELQEGGARALIQSPMEIMNLINDFK